MEHSKDEYVLHATAIVGSGISLFFCTTSLVAFFCLRPRSQTFIVKQQLTLAIGLTQLVLLLGIAAYRYKEGCKALSVLLHFAASSCFSWSAVDSLHLYFVHVNRHHPMKKVSYYMGIGWGVPVIVLATSVAVGHTGRPNSPVSNNSDVSRLQLALYKCWGTDHVVWTFIVPAIAIATINVIILASIIKQLRQPSYDVCCRAVLEKRATRYGLRTNALLLLGLCLGWIFGMLAFKDTNNMKFQLSFGMVNGLQGIFVFFFHCILSIDIKYPFDTGGPHTCRHEEGCGVSQADQPSRSKRTSSNLHESQSAARRKISSRTQGNENIPLISVGSPPTTVDSQKNDSSEPLTKPVQSDTPAPAKAVNDTQVNTIATPTNQESTSRSPDQQAVTNLPGTPETDLNRKGYNRKSSPPILSNQILLEVERSRKSSSDPSITPQGAQRVPASHRDPQISNGEQTKNDAKLIAPIAGPKRERKSSRGRGSSLNELESLFSDPNMTRPQRFSLGSLQSPGAKVGHERKTSQEERRNKKSPSNDVVVQPRERRSLNEKPDTRTLQRQSSFS